MPVSLAGTIDLTTYDRSSSSSSALPAGAQPEAGPSSLLAELWLRHQLERRELLDHFDHEPAPSSFTPTASSSTGFAATELASPEELLLVALSTRHTSWTALLLRHGAELEVAVQQIVGRPPASAVTAWSTTSAAEGGSTDELLFALDDVDVGWLSTDQEDPAADTLSIAPPTTHVASQGHPGPDDAEHGSLLLQQLLASPAVSAVSTASSSSMATSASGLSFGNWADWSPEGKTSVGGDLSGQTEPSSWSSDFDAGLEQMFSLGSPALSLSQPPALELAALLPPAALAFQPADLLGTVSTAEGPLDTFPASAAGESSRRSPTLFAGFASAKAAPTTKTTAATASAGPSRPLRRSPTGGPLERSKFSCDACLLRRKKCTPHPRPDGSLPQIGDCADCVRDAAKRRLGAVECTYDIRRTNVDRARRNGSLREPFHHVLL